METIDTIYQLISIDEKVKRKKTETENVDNESGVSEKEKGDYANDKRLKFYE